MQRFAELLKSVAQVGVLLVLFAYPIVLVYLGIAYGWMAFWSSLAGSFLMVGVLLSMTRYSRNFDRPAGSSATPLASLVVAFIAMAGFYLGLFQFKLLMIPLFLGIIAGSFALLVLRGRL